MTDRGEGKADARDIFLHALDGTRVARAMERRVGFDAGNLVVDGHPYAPRDYERVLLVAIGKAAGTMTAAFLCLAGDAAPRMKGIVAGVSAERLPGNMRVFYGGHPSPNQASLDAATAILQLLEGATERDLVVYL